MYRNKDLGVLEMKRESTSSRGFTLIELLTTVTVIAVLVAVSAPSFMTFQRSSQLTSFTNSIFAAINAARGEAMKRGRYALVVPADGSDWNSGWLVFVDVNRNQVYDADEDVSIQVSEAPPSYIAVSGTAGSAAASGPYIMFDASGYAKDKTNAFSGSTLEIKRNDVTGSEVLTQTRRLKTDPTGRMRVCTPKSSSDALCST